MKRRTALFIAIALAACSAGPTVVSSDETAPAASAEESTSTTTAPVSTTATVADPSSTTTTEPPPLAGPVEVAISEGSGAAGSSQFNPRSYRLQQDVAYRFGEFVPPLLFTPPVEHWEVADYSRDSLSLRWRGPSGFRPGTLVVAAFGLADSGDEESWLALEEWIASELAAVDETLTWLEIGTVAVGSTEVEWRELRTTDRRPIEIISAPCVIDLPGGECVWFESAARFLVVPVGGLTVTIVVTEQLCDCDVGGLPGRFDQDNELEDWVDLIEAVLAALEFES